MSSAFVDPALEPTPERVRAALGTTAGVWDELLAHLAGRGVDVSWRYYRDGGWLAKASHGGRTVAWLSVDPGLIRVAFYFAERHRGLLAGQAGLPLGLRERVVATGLVGRLLPVGVELAPGADLAAFVELVRLKLAAR